MAININKFNEFLELERQIPIGLQICSQDNFKMIFNAELPPISDEELEKCLLFIHSDFTKKLKKLKDECISEIEQYMFDLPNEQLNKYLILSSTRLDSAMKFLGLIGHLSKIRNSNILTIHQAKIDAFDRIQMTNYTIISLFYIDVNECYNCYYIMKNFIANRQSELIKILETDKNSISKSRPNPKGLTHRQHAIIDKYKTDAKYTNKILKRTEIRHQFGKGREKAIDSVNEHSKSYRKITANELEIIIPRLVDFPNAKKAAENDLAKLN